MTYDDFSNWVKLTISTDSYTFSRGMWVDTPATANVKFCAIMETGGPAPDVDDRRKNFRVFLVGAREKRADVVPVGADMERLALAALGTIEPCGAANARALAEPNGPIFTTEGRVVFMLDFQVVY